jgi:hypothetical protein
MTAAQASGHKASGRRFLTLSTVRVAAGLGLTVAGLSLGGCTSRLFGSIHLPHNPIHIHHHRVIRSSNALPPSNVTAIGVNSYLWRASLETLSFMPLLQTDSAGGVIVTDWYENPGNPGERMKVTVAILDKDLRSDALRVSASRQVMQNGVWADAPVQAATVQRLEDVILTKARDLRRGSTVR